MTSRESGARSDTTTAATPPGRSPSASPASTRRPATDGSERGARALKDRVVVVKGAGELATGVVCRLYRANLRRILMLETDCPLAVRRRVAFCEAVHEGAVTVEGIEAVRVDDPAEAEDAWREGRIAVLVDPRGASIPAVDPDVLVEATLAKRNDGWTREDAPLVIALGPGFEAGRDCDVVVETNRGHDLGRLIERGAAQPNTGVPGNIAGYTLERVLRAPADGVFVTDRRLGDRVSFGEVLGHVGEAEVTATLDGILRGLIRPGSRVRRGLKIGDIDPRGRAAYCDTISEKARSIGGAVLEAILARFNE